MTDRYRFSSTDVVADLQRRLSDAESLITVLQNQGNTYFGTTPPDHPSDGSEWIYDGGGYFWRFRYDSRETTYKWKFIGGPPLIASNDGDRGTAGGGYGWWADLTLTIPRAGHYGLSHDLDMYVPDIHDTIPVQWLVYLGDGTNTFDGSYLRYNFTVYGNNYPHAVHQSQGYKNFGALAANASIRQYIAAPQGWDFIATYRLISAIPIKVI